MRNLKNSIRSEDPLFSMSCIGPDAKTLMKREKPTLLFEEKIDF